MKKESKTVIGIDSENNTHDDMMGMRGGIQGLLRLGLTAAKLVLRCGQSRVIRATRGMAV